MKLVFKIFFIFSSILTSFFLVASAYAISESVMADALGAAVNPSTIPSTLAPGSMAALLCSFRILFCGGVTTVMVATAIFLIGIMIISRKMKWPYGVLIITFIVLLINPELLVKAISHLQIFGTDINLSFFSNVCTCANMGAISGSLFNL